MNFFKQAQEFAASATTKTSDDDNTAAAPGSAAPAAGDGNLPGGRTAPTNEELLKSGQLLFGAAQGQKVDSSQLAGAASDLLGGLASHGNIDQGTYGTYINQAEGYLDKYSAKGQSQGQSATGAGAAGGQSEGPSTAGAGGRAANVNSQVPDDSQSAPDARAQSTTDQSDGSFQSPSDQSADRDTAPGNAGRTDDYAQDQQQQAGGPSPGNSQY